MAAGDDSQRSTLDALETKDGSGTKIWSESGSGVGEDRLDVLLVGASQRFLVTAPRRAGEETHRLEAALAGPHLCYSMGAKAEVGV